MRITLTRSAGAFATAFLLLSSAHAADMLTDKKGMTLYTCDKDTGGMSNCYDDCAKQWQPYIGQKGDAMQKNWTLDRAQGRDDAMGL